MRLWASVSPCSRLSAVLGLTDALERRYLEAAAKERGAELIADGRLRDGRREYPNVSSEEQAEEVALAMMRADAFNNARAILEDLREEAFGTHDRWALCAILAAAHEAANAEYRRISAEVWPSLG